MKILITPQADKDVRDLYNYIKFGLKNASAARTTVDGIKKEIKKLETSPYIGSSCLFSTSLFSTRYKNFLIFYKVSQQIEILRIGYARRDWVSLFQDC